MVELINAMTEYEKEACTGVLLKENNFSVGRDDCETYDNMNGAAPDKDSTERIKRAQYEKSGRDEEVNNYINCIFILLGSRSAAEVERVVCWSMHVLATVLTRMGRNVSNHIGSNNSSQLMGNGGGEGGT